MIPELIFPLYGYSTQDEEVALIRCKEGFSFLGQFFPSSCGGVICVHCLHCLWRHYIVFTIIVQSMHGGNQIFPWLRYFVSNSLVMTVPVFWNVIASDWELRYDITSICNISYDITMFNISYNITWVLSS